MTINATLIGQSIAFAFFVWFCVKFVWPPIIAVMQERQKKIAEGLNAAGRAEHELNEAKKKIDQAIHESREQATEILDKANKTAANIIEEAKRAAKIEGERIVTNARAEVDIEVNRVKDQLRDQVASLAVLGAEKILESSVDASAHNELVNKIASKL